MANLTGLSLRSRIKHDVSGVSVRATVSASSHAKITATRSVGLVVESSDEGDV